MSALRDPLVQALKAGLPGTYTVWDDDLPGTLTKRSVAVFTRNLKALPEAPIASYALTLSVLVVSPLEDPAKAEDQRDSMLLDVLGALWDADGVLVDECRVADYSPSSDGPTYLVWEIDTTSIVQKGQD